MKHLLAVDLPALKSSARRSDGVTDLCLAELASSSKGMKLATFDTHIKHAAVQVIK